MFRVFFYENCRGFEDIKDISDDYKIDDVELLKKKLFDDFVDVEIISSWFNENINDVNVDMVVDYDNEKGIGLLNISEELGVWFYKNEDAKYSINETMVAQGYAWEYDGGKKEKDLQTLRDKRKAPNE